MDTASWQLESYQQRMREQLFRIAHLRDGYSTRRAYYHYLRNESSLNANRPGPLDSSIVRGCSTPWLLVALDGWTSRQEHQDTRACRAISSLPCLHFRNLLACKRERHSKELSLPHAGIRPSAITREAAVVSGDFRAPSASSAHGTFVAHRTRSIPSHSFLSVSIPPR